MYINDNFNDTDIKILRSEFKIETLQFYDILDNLIYNNTNDNIFCIDFLPEKIYNLEKYNELEKYRLEIFSKDNINEHTENIFADDKFADQIINITFNLITYFPCIIYLIKNDIITSYENNINKDGFYKLADLINYIIKFDIGCIGVLLKCNENLYLLLIINGGYNISIHFSNISEQSENLILLEKLIKNEGLFLRK